MSTPPSSLFTARLPELYEQYLVAPLFRPFAQDLLHRVALRDHERLLDLACGTGIVARLARESLGDRVHIVGLDASPEMLGVARRVAPGIDWRQGDATRLPAGDDEVFDAVTCHQGLQFFPDKPAAIREMRRVLAPGARLAIGTWLSAEDLPLMRDLQRVAERRLGPIEDRRHSFGSGEALAQLLTDAGFVAVRVETVTHAVRLSGGTDVFPRLNAMALVGMSAAAKTMTDEQRAETIAAVAADSVEAARAYLDGEDLVFDLTSNVATARR
ncbi:MAG TPA: methyltransferase domain-containing protein [Vicinamibacterales bacterium]|nr:methyltransferase domain-containing protein [Vicinamibacterales bacterium]